MPWLKAIYRAEAADMALDTARGIRSRMGQTLSGYRTDMATRLEHVVPFFAFASGIRKMIYTTNCIEALKPLAAQDHQNTRQFSKR